MSPYMSLLRRDLQGMYRDPLLLTGLLGPLPLLLLARCGFPALNATLAARTAVRLDAYAPFAAMLLVSIIPMLIGLMSGFLLLEERDERLLAYYAVTPLKRRGYLLARLLLPMGLAAVWSALFLGGSGLTMLTAQTWPALVLLALEAPLFALLLAGLAANKVEGLALSKLGGLFIAAPVAFYLLPRPWSYAAALLPNYWTALSYDIGSLANGFPPHLAPAFAAGLALHLLLLAALLARFVRRPD